MKKIYYLQKHPVKIGDVVEYNGFRATVTEELIELNPELFVVKDSMQELLDKAKRDYPIGTMINSKYGIQKVLSDKPFIGRVITGTIQINTAQFPGGATIYNPEDGWCEILPLKFTTEDGVNIYGDMKTYIVKITSLRLEKQESWDGKGKNNKYFYHKENALAYIEKHKEKSLVDYEKILLHDRNLILIEKNIAFKGSFYQRLKENEPKLYYTKILQLIADDLNGGWVADFSDNKEKWLIKERTSNCTMGTSGWTERDNCGAVPFKTMELSEKARAILGDKVKYLFN